MIKPTTRLLQFLPLTNDGAFHPAIALHLVCPGPPTGTGTTACSYGCSNSPRKHLTPLRPRSRPPLRCSFHFAPSLGTWTPGTRRATTGNNLLINGHRPFLAVPVPTNNVRRSRRSLKLYMCSEFGPALQAGTPIHTPIPSKIP